MSNKINQFVRATMATTGVMGLAFASTMPAMAHEGTHMYQANLTSLNKSDDSGNSTVTLSVDGDQLTVKTTGTSPSLPHAQHIHIGGNNVCPDPSADKDNDGLINTAEGEPSYGPIEISLTTEGDISPDSGLAVDRFPTADADGNITYERTVTLPEGVTEEDIANGVIVQHGISELFDDKAKYDGERKSEIPGGEELPLEATIPSSCGELTEMPSGGIATGGGSTSGVENMGILGAGSAAVIGAGALLVNRRNRQFNS